MRSLKSRLLAPIAFACVAVAGVPSMAAAADSFQLRSTLSIFENTFAPDSTCAGILGGQIRGSGVNPRLGRFTLAATDCITPTVSGYSFFSSNLVLTAANGDTLTGFYGGTFMLDPATGVGTIVDGSFMITGGTGHFTNAHGTGTIAGFEQFSQQTPPTGQGQVQLSGTVYF